MGIGAGGAQVAVFCPDRFFQARVTATQFAKLLLDHFDLCWGRILLEFQKDKAVVRFRGGYRGGRFVAGWTVFAGEGNLGGGEEACGY